MKKYAPLLKKEYHTFHKQPAFVYNGGGHVLNADGGKGGVRYIYCEKCHTWHEFHHQKRIEGLHNFRGRKYCNNRIQRIRIVWDILEHREDFPTVQDIINKHGEAIKKLVGIKDSDSKREGQQTDPFFRRYTFAEIFKGYPKTNRWIPILFDDYSVGIRTGVMNGAFDPYSCESFDAPMRNEVSKSYFYSRVVPELQKVIRYYSNKNTMDTEFLNWNNRWWAGTHFKCPSCGAQGFAKHMTGGNHNFYPVNATIFSMEDGSKTVSFIMREESPLFVKKAGSEEYHDKPLYRYRELQGRIVFSADGHTYVKAPVELDTKKVLDENDRAWAYKSNIMDVTYSGYGLFYDIAIRAMEDEEVLPVCYRAMNRFRNASKQLTDSLQRNFSAAHCREKTRENFARNFFSTD